MTSTRISNIASVTAGDRGVTTAFADDTSLGLATDANNLTAEAQTKMASALSRILADSFMLYGKTHGFHWNVTGPMFASLHELFREQYSDLFQAIDVIAERIRAIDQTAPFGAGPLRDLSVIPDATGVPSAMDMVRELEADHRTLSARCRAAAVLAEELGDTASNDLLIDRVRTHDKAAWMLRSIHQ